MIRMIHARFGTARRGIRWTTPSPGPAAYPPRVFIGNEGRKQSISARRPDTSPKYGLNTPGPGAYQIVFRKTAASGFTIGKEKRSNLSFEGRNVPGPLAYTPNDKIMRKTSPLWA